MIRTSNVSRTFGDGEVAVTALAPTSVTINDGEFVVITGPSGAGKSTLLYQIGLLDQPTSGSVYLDEVDTSVLSESERTALRRHKLGYIFQDYSLLPELTAAENVALLLLSQGLPPLSAYQKSQTVLERLGLGHRLGNYPSQLSGGEQQRVSIARAIVHDPIALLADEPTANLDSNTSKLVMNYLLELNRGGQTVVMVTHETEYARLAKRVISLRDGKVQSDTKNPPSDPVPSTSSI